MNSKYQINDLLDTLSEHNGIYGLFANPGFGTTILSMQIAEAVAKTTNAEVVVFSLEMSKEQWYQRMKSTGLSVDRIKVIDDFQVSSNLIETTIKNTQNARLVIIDYLNLLDYDVCQELPRISKAYSVPIFVCGKLPRNSGDFDPHKTPELISVPYQLLQLHQYDFLALLHREHDCDRNIGTAHRYNISNSVELIVKINIFGKIGKIYFEWDDQQKCFKI